jgi:hypothetical protein
MPEPAWATKKEPLPLTGNPVGANFLVAALNAFNLAMAGFALDANLTIDRVLYLFEHTGRRGYVPPMPYDGVPIALGLVPLVFSLGIFAFPLVRAIVQPYRARAAARENARLAVLREVLTRVENGTPIDEPVLAAAWKRATGEAPTSKELTRIAVDLGGDVDPSEGEVRYRFADLEAEQAALEEERAHASDEEARAGKVVFASDDREELR